VHLLATECARFDRDAEVEADRAVIPRIIHS
jgi:hypothetical protein